MNLFIEFQGNRDLKTTVIYGYGLIYYHKLNWHFFSTGQNIKVYIH